MKLVKRCNAPDYGLTDHFPAFDVPFSLQRSTVSPFFPPYQKKNQTLPAFTESPSTLKGEAIFIEADT